MILFVKNIGIAKFFESSEIVTWDTIDLEKSTNLYTISKAVPVSLIDQESAMKGLGSHKNKCGLTCQDVVVENQETYHPEFCPIIANHVASSECCTE